MARNRSRKDPNWISPKEKREMSTKNSAGYSDYTPFNALTGKEVISKTNVINPGKKVPGSYSK